METIMGVIWVDLGILNEFLKYCMLEVPTTII